MSARCITYRIMNYTYKILASGEDFSPAPEASRTIKCAGFFIEAVIVSLVLLNTVAIVFQGPYQYLLVRLSIGIFSVEYLIRLWCCVESPMMRNSDVVSLWRLRLKWCLELWPLIDLVCLIPFYAELFVVNSGNSEAGLVLRCIRLVKC